MNYTVYNLSTGSSLYDVNVSTSSWSLQDALSISFLPDYEPYESYTVGVYHDACESAGAQNCTAFCSNLTTMFGSLQTFQNCLLYPWVVNLGINESSNESPLAKSLSIVNRSQEIQVAHNVTTSILGCLREYCGNNTQCASDLPEFYQLNFNRLPSLGFDICGFAAPFSYLDADIAGIGVSCQARVAMTRFSNVSGPTRFTSHTGFNPVLPSLG